MQVRIFSGSQSSVEEGFNAWAKGKALSKDILIHSDADGAYVFIFVYYPERPPFISVEPKKPKIKVEPPK